MGALPERVEHLLKGLLTQNPAARWTWPRIERWCQGESPPEYYASSRHVRFFHYEGLAYSISDAALEMARREDTWAESIDQVLNLDNEQCLGGFVCSPRGDPELRLKLKEVAGLIDSEDFAHLPAPLVREVVGAVALMLLGAETFSWRGRPVTLDRLRAEILPTMRPEDLLAYELIAHPGILSRIRTVDKETARILKAAARSADEAMELLAERHGFDREAAAERAKLWALILLPNSELLEKQAEFRKLYTRSSSPDLDDLLKRDELSQAELIILNLTASEPERFGYTSAVDETKRRHAELRAAGEALRQTLFWLRLQQAIRFSFLILARWPEWGGLLTIFAMIGFAGRPGPVWGFLTLLPIGILVLARSFLQRAIAKAVRKYAPKARPWKWSDGVQRCRREASHQAREPQTSRVLTRLEQVNHQLAQLTLIDPPPRPINPAPRPTLVWASAALSLCLVGGMTFFFLQGIVENPPNLPSMRAAWTFSDAGMQTDERHLRMPGHRHDPRSRDGSAAHLNISGEALSASDLQYAAARGQDLAAYHALVGGANRPIAIRLPAEGRILFAIYDSVEQRVMRDVAYEVAAEPEIGRLFILDGVAVRYYGP